MLWAVRPVHPAATGGGGSPHPPPVSHVGCAGRKSPTDKRRRGTDKGNGYFLDMMGAWGGGGAHQSEIAPGLDVDPPPKTPKPRNLCLSVSLASLSVFSVGRGLQKRPGSRARFVVVCSGCRPWDPDLNLGPGLGVDLHLHLDLDLDPGPGAKALSAWPRARGRSRSWWRSSRDGPP